MPAEAAIIGLIILAIIFSSQPKKRWRCPAPNCDFSTEEENKKLADAHALAHMKHLPVLKDA